MGDPTARRQTWPHRQAPFHRLDGELLELLPRPPGQQGEELQQARPGVHREGLHRCRVGVHGDEVLDCPRDELLGHLLGDDIKAGHEEVDGVLGRLPRVLRRPLGDLPDERDAGREHRGHALAQEDPRRVGLAAKGPHQGAQGVSCALGLAEGGGVQSRRRSAGEELGRHCDEPGELRLDLGQVVLILLLRVHALHQRVRKEDPDGGCRPLRRGGQDALKEPKEPLEGLEPLELRERGLHHHGEGGQGPGRGDQHAGRHRLCRRAQLEASHRGVQVRPHDLLRARLALRRRRQLPHPHGEHGEAVVSKLPVQVCVFRDTGGDLSLASEPPVLLAHRQHVAADRRDEEERPARGLLVPLGQLWGAPGDDAEAGGQVVRDGLDAVLAALEDAIGGRQGRPVDLADLLEGPGAKR
mmetsp:Transcript_1139/g.3997  ORF Transcript_1139/g.3997 Transcript_1139/m.3997 type:complete len:412 (-) Transcript_1139:1487-2722(-)